MIIDRISRVNFKHVNIALIGLSGTGKSTLINELYGCKLAEEGIGALVTMKINEYPAIIRHARHWMQPSGRNGWKSGISFLRDKNNNVDMKQHIHFVAYIRCVQWAIVVTVEPNESWQLEKSRRESRRREIVRVEHYWCRYN